ncbi:hypothetical protein DFH06DRAFT_1122261 [Mycena polygramma]|nr:hypothetical protein DFH06DRAFT_1122261 [Mycena polygramma]
MTPPALQVQEICDHIVDFLRESHRYLKVCALISPVFTSSAQRQIFREINLVVSSYIPPSKREIVRRGSRLHALLVESPHLLQFIRCLSVVFDPDVLRCLAGVQFANLEAVVLSGPLASFPRRGISSLAAPLLAMPSVRRVKLTSILFDDITIMCTLLHQRTTPLDSLSMEYVDVHTSPKARTVSMPEQKLVTIKAFQINLRDHAWLTHPRCPLDVRSLGELVLGHDYSSGLVDLLTLDVFAGFGKTTAAVDFFLAIAQEPFQFQLQHIRIRVAVFKTLDVNSLCRLDAALADLHFPLRTVNVLVTPMGNGAGGLSSDELALLMGRVRVLLPRLDAGVNLRLSYIHRSLDYNPTTPF